MALKPASNRSLHVAVIGVRGIPNVQGGVETHCEQLYPLLVQRGIEVTLFGRTPYLESPHPYDFKGVKVVPVNCPRHPRYEAILHTIRCLWKCRKIKPDVVHLHAIGPALVTPLARLLGFPVVFTHHGPDYDRNKWGLFAKLTLRLGEQLGSRFSQKVVVISNTIARNVKEKCGRRDTHLVFNGVRMPPALADSEIESHLRPFGLKKGGYILALGRLVPEKGFHDLIAAWAQNPDFPQLVIAGDSDHSSGYAANLKREASAKGVTMTGFIKGAALNSVLAGARLFVLPSYHEGLPIALLEAMSHDLDVVVSDIPANRDVELPETHYFQTGNIKSLGEAIARRLADEPAHFRNLVVKRYNWDLIADQTLEIYESIVRRDGLDKTETHF